MPVGVNDMNSIAVHVFRVAALLTFHDLVIRNTRNIPSFAHLARLCSVAVVI